MLKNAVDAFSLFSLVPDDLLEGTAEDLSVDKWVRKLKGPTLFKLILYSILSHDRLSLRLLSDSYEEVGFRSLVPDLESETVGHTGIHDRLKKIKVEYFAKLFDHFYEEVSKHYSGQTLHGYHLKRYDSTMIATFSHLLNGMKVGNTKNGKRQVKVTTCFTGDFLIKFTFHTAQPYLSEERALKKSIAKNKVDKSDKTQVHVFDNGLKKRLTLKEFDDDGQLFLTRFAKNTRYLVQRSHLCCEDKTDLDNEELSFIQDSIVYLYASGHKVVEHEFRLIQYQVKGSEEVLTFVTNILDLSALEVANIYRKRWDIEVLFRFLKQEMNLTHFVCHDLNAIKVMLYCTLMAAMLVLIYKKEHKIKSYKRAKQRFFKELRYHLFLEILDGPNGEEHLKKLLTDFIHRKQV